MSMRSAVAALLGWVLFAPAAGAADASRGARLYLQLPGDVPSCVSCHGADPAASRNNLLRAADQPLVLLKTLGAVSAMGYLKPLLSDTDIDDLAAYLGAVSRAAAASTFAVWPRTVDFGTLPPGAASPVAQVRWRNLSTRPVAPPAVHLVDRRFEIEHDCRQPVAPGADCRISLRALAASSGDLADALRIGAEPAALVGVAARVRVQPLPVWVADAPSGSVDFGAVVVGESLTRQVTLRNAGTAAGEVGVAALTGPGSTAFELTDGCALAGVLLPGQACTLGLRFRPGTAASLAATLQWRGEGTAAPTLELSGQGQAASGVVTPPPQTPTGGSGGGGCAAAPLARPGDITLAALVLAAAAALRRRRQRASWRRGM